MILCGGLGSRLGSLTRTCPKPMLPIADRPFLEVLIKNLLRYGIDDIVLCTGYLSNTFKDYFGNGESLNVSIRYSKEDNALGTGGALKKASDYLEESFFVLNGDCFFDINYLSLSAEVLGSNHLIGGVSLRRIDFANRYGVVEVDEDNIVRGFVSKTTKKNVLINGGVYFFNKKILRYIPDGFVSLEEYVIPNVINDADLFGLEFNDFFIDIGMPEDFKNAQSMIPSCLKKPAVFFDRDGVLNYDYKYVHSVEKFEWITDAIEAIKFCNDSGYYAVIVTNQSGIGKGFYSERDFHYLCNWMNLELMKKGAHIDKIYYCPHYEFSEEQKYRQNCDCRKPSSGMIKDAANDWEIMLSTSFLIGDKITDILAANNVGVKGVLFDATKDNLLSVVEQHMNLSNRKR